MLIQLDRIPDADTAELERLESGVARLLESQPGLASSALGKYAAKQQQCVRAELDERRARARVLELLIGLDLEGHRVEVVDACEGPRRRGKGSAARRAPRKSRLCSQLGSRVFRQIGVFCFVPCLS